MTNIYNEIKDLIQGSESTLYGVGYDIENIFHNYDKNYGEDYTVNTIKDNDNITLEYSIGSNKIAVNLEFKVVDKKLNPIYKVESVILL